MSEDFLLPALFFNPSSSWPSKLLDEEMLFARHQFLASTVFFLEDLDESTFSFQPLFLMQRCCVFFRLRKVHLTLWTSCV